LHLAEVNLITNDKEIMMKQNYAPAYKHQAIEMLYENVYWVHGSIKMAPAMSMNRNMIILKQGTSLYLINPIRLNEAEENKLKALGKVKAILRLGDFHGIDDAYYIDTFKCEFWCQAGQSTYPDLKPDHVITAESKAPIENAEFFIFSTSIHPEAALLLKDKKLLITTDSVQNWTDWSHTSGPAKLLLRLMGFKLRLLIGKPWLKRVTPTGKSMLCDFEALLKLEFDSLVAAHGKPLLANAHAKLSAVVSETFS